MGKTVFLFLLAAGLAALVVDFSSSPATAAGAVASVVHTLVWLGVGLWLIKRHPAAPGWTPLLLALAWGAACSAPAIYLNTESVLALRDASLGRLDGFLHSPLSEETLKLLGVIAVCALFVRPRRAIDAVPLGMAAGLGFALAEDPHFILNRSIEALQGDTSGAVLGALLRVVSMPFCHCLFTGLAAFGVGVFFTRTRRLRSILAWWALAVAVHTLFNLLPSLPGWVPSEALGAAAVGARLLGGWVVAIALYRRSVGLARAAEPEAAPAGV